MVGVCDRECMGNSPGDETQTLMRCHSCGFSQLYEACGWKSVCGQAYKLKSIKGNIYSLLFFLKLCFSFTGAHFMA